MKQGNKKNSEGGGFFGEVGENLQKGAAGKIGGLYKIGSVRYPLPTMDLTDVLQQL